jgi:predicted RNA methylase
MNKIRKRFNRIFNRKGIGENEKRTYMITEDQFKDFFYIYSDINFNMLNDKERLLMLEKAIEKVVKSNDVVADLGAGTGILSIFASKKARKVYSIEVVPQLYSFGKKISERNEFGGKITFLLGDARVITLPEKVNVIICWMPDTALVNELQVPVMNHAIKELLVEGGRVIPHSFITKIQLIQTNYMIDNVEFRLFSVETSYTKERHTHLSKETAFHRIDLRKVNALDVEKRFTITTTKSGTLNALKFTTYAQLTDTIIVGPTVFSLRPYIIPLEKNYKIRKNQKVTISLSFKLGGGLGNFKKSISI